MCFCALQTRNGVRVLASERERPTGRRPQFLMRVDIGLSTPYTIIPQLEGRNPFEAINCIEQARAGAHVEGQRAVNHPFSAS